MKQLTDKEVYLVAVATIDKKKPEVIALINKYCVKLSPSADLKTIDSAFLTLAKQSVNFRKEFSDLSAQASVSFTGENGFFNASGGTPSLSGNANALVNASNPTSGTTSSSGGIFSKIGEYFSPDVFKSIVNTGLNVWSVKQTGQNAPTAQGSMDTAREQYYEEQGSQKSQKSGMGVGSIILLSVGGLLLLGGIIYFVRKK
jgi:hypothetical protein